MSPAGSIVVQILRLLTYISGDGKRSARVEMRISATAKEVPSRGLAGTTETLARRGSVVPLGASGIR